MGIVVLDLAVVVVTTNYRTSVEAVAARGAWQREAMYSRVIVNFPSLRSPMVAIVCIISCMHRKLENSHSKLRLQFATLGGEL